MEHLFQLWVQLRTAEEFIDLFYGQKAIKPTLDRALKHRRVLIKKISRIQIRMFDRE